MIKILDFTGFDLISALAHLIYDSSLIRNAEFKLVLIMSEKGRRTGNFCEQV